MKKLIAAAKELNDVLGLDPKIKVVGISEQELGAKILEAAELIVPEEDEITEKTQAAIDELKAAAGTADDDDAPADDTADEDADDADGDDDQDDAPEDDDDDDQDDENQALLDSIQAETELKPLKALIKSNDLFKGLRKTAPGIFEIDVLKKGMYKALGVDITPEPAKPAPAPVKKGGPAAPGKPAAAAPAAKPAAKPAAPAKPAKPAPVKTGEAYTRIDSVCEAIKGGVKTVDDLIKVSNDIYVKKGGKDNVAEARTMSRYVVKTLAHFNVEVSVPTV